MSSTRRLGGRVWGLLVAVVMIIGVGVLAVIAARDRSAGAPDPAANAVAPSPDPTIGPAGNGVVEWVIDGDTIDVTFNGRTERVRLIGINTPEVAHESSGDRPGNAAECYGPEATEFTRSLIPPGTAVRVERDTVARDDYGRILGYVFRADDDVFVNYELIHQGFARPLAIEPNTTYRATFADAATSAEQADRGLWANCD